MLSDFETLLAASRIPEHLHHGLLWWVTEGVSPGHFLSAAISGDLLKAAVRADNTSSAALGQIGWFLATQMPEGSVGPRAATDWPLFLAASKRQADAS